MLLSPILVARTGGEQQGKQPDNDGDDQDAQAGGKDPDKLNQALESASGALRELLTV